MLLCFTLYYFSLQILYESEPTSYCLKSINSVAFNGHLVHININQVDFVELSEDARYPRDGRHVNRQVSHTDISDHRTVPKRHRSYGTKHKDTVSRGTSMHR